MIMNKLHSIIICIALLVGFSACTSQWESHYNTQNVTSDGSVEIFSGNIKEYLQSDSHLSSENRMLQEAGVYDKMKPRQEYTLLAYPNDILDASEYASMSDYANYCISDIALSPNMMSDGLGIHTWYQDKNVWIHVRGEERFIEDNLITKVVKTDNGYIYFLSGITPIIKSIYDILNGLDDAQYSTFKNLVRKYERSFFDKDKCTPAGTNEMGNTVYSDSVKGWTVKNILMDRYTANGQEYWNMRSEDYNSTMLIPSNEVIQAAIDTAMAKIPLWLRRRATAADRTKFEQWIVKACFIDKRLSASQIDGLNDIDCVGGYQKDTLEGTEFTQTEAAMWRPTVQKVRTNDCLNASNGNVYFIDFLKIPNNVIIYRLKARFYQLWNNMTQAQRDQYFRWEHWTEPMIINDAQGSFQLSETLPTMYYHVLTAIPDKVARRDSLTCSVTYDGVLYNESNPRGEQIQECFIPAGEYYLRMGFKHSLLYSLSIQFNDTLLVKDMVMYAQGSNFHFDRGSVSVVDAYGASSIGYPEGYNWHDWEELSEKAQAYDTDGYQVGIVHVKQDGNFTITISSSDMSYLYDYTAERNTSNVKQLMMYHWCLRPTKNNY